MKTKKKKSGKRGIGMKTEILMETEWNGKKVEKMEYKEKTEWNMSLKS